MISTRKTFRKSNLRIITYFVSGSITVVQLTSSLTGLEWTKRVGKSVANLYTVKLLNVNGEYCQVESAIKGRIIIHSVPHIRALQIVATRDVCQPKVS